MRGWVIGMIVAILVTAGIGLLLVAASANVSCQGGGRAGTALILGGLVLRFRDA